MTIVQCFEKINDGLKDSGLNPEKMNSLNNELNIVCNFFDCSREAAVLLAIIIIQNLEDDAVQVRKLTQHLGLRSSRFFDLKKYLDPLLQKKIITCNYERHGFQHSSLELAPWLFDAITQNDKTKLKTEPIDNAIRFLQFYGFMVDERMHGNIGATDLCTWLNNFIETHLHIPFVCWLHSLKLTNEEYACYLSCCIDLLNGEDQVDVEKMLNTFISDLNDRYTFRKSLRNGTSKLISEELIELDDFGLGISSFSFIKLTEKSTDRLMEEDAVLLKKDFRSKFAQLVSADKIAEHKLIYGESLKQRVSQLEQLLQEQQLKNIQSRLKENGMTPGFTILLYGDPGTGKTETALQLARQCRRHLLQVEISKVRSMWVGETEKNIKKVFTEYKEAMSYFDPCPVLLFNEADALLGKRREINQRVDQMENSMQNILLQELEVFEGIFIATTNLIINLDPAFDRRLLYKIQFDKPDEAARLKIWKEKIPNFNEETLQRISSHYELTGGQIENIRKKIFIDSLLQTDLNVDEKLLMRLIEEELQMGKGKERRVIGFNMTQHF